MLKISFSETPLEERWILHGRLTAPWVHELGACWKKNHSKAKQRLCIVDLTEITFIDKSGERLLRVLLREGAQLIPGGLYTKHIVEQLGARRKRNIPNRLASLLAALLPVLIAMLIDATALKAQTTTTLGSVPSGPASDQVLRLTLRDAVNMALPLQSRSD